MPSFDFDYLEKHAQDYASDEKPASENLSGENEENANDLAILGSASTQAFMPSRAYASGVPLLTGDELLDTKMASGKMSKYDIYTAQKAGIPVMAIMQNINANVNLDAKVRNKSSSTTKLRQDFYENMKALKAVDNIVSSADEEAKGGFLFRTGVATNNTGFLGGLDRKLDSWSGGIYKLSPNAQKFKADEETAISVVGRIITGGGKLSNQQKDEMRDAYGIGFRKGENARAQAIAQNDIILDDTMRKAELLYQNGDITPQQLAELQSYQAKNEYLKANNENFDKDAYHKAGYQIWARNKGYLGQNGQNSQNPSQNQGYQSPQAPQMPQIKFSK